MVVNKQPFQTFGFSWTYQINQEKYREDSKKSVDIDVRRVLKG